MNNNFTIDRTRTLPPILQADETTHGVAQVIGEQMTSVAQNIHKNIIYGRLDEASETLLDILAYDLHVDWYDYTYPVDIKRAIIRNCVKIHRHMGTKYAVETATSDVYHGTTVEEWFEYGGEPYYFRLNLDVSAGGITGEQQFSLYEKIKYYKNCRSHLDGLNVKISSEATLRAGCCSGYTHKMQIMPFLTTEIITPTSDTIVGACTQIKHKIQIAERRE